MKLVIRLYIILLRFYPRSFRDEFADEMCLVFRETLAEAVERGLHAVLVLVLREVCDLPKSILFAYLEERGGQLMQTSIETERQTYWFEVLAGLVPFIILGPIQAMVPYSYEFRVSFNIGNDQKMFEFWLLMGVGTLLGLVRQFPRWSYPYMVMFVFVPLVNGIARITVLLPPERFRPEFHLPLLFVFFAVLSVIVILIARVLKPMHYLYQSIRQDWTRLSFGLFSYVAFATGFYGGDHPPPFSISVLLPSTIVVFGALAYLLSINQRQRILSLLLALALVSIVIPGWEEVPAWSALLFLLAIVFLPALLELLRRNPKTAE